MTPTPCATAKIMARAMKAHILAHAPVCEHLQSEVRRLELEVQLWKYRAEHGLTGPPRKFSNTSRGRWPGRK